MTPDERNLLSSFLRDLVQARASGKDAEAEALIAQAFAANPDAAYLIVQHAILSDEALHAAQQRIAQLEAAQAGSQGGGFLGARPQPQPQPQPSTAVPTSGPWGPAPQPAASPFSSGGGLGSFLRNAGTMAAGVAAGDMLFSGLSGLFGGHRGFGFGGPFGGYGAPVENVTINEYDDRGGDWNDPGAGYDDGGYDDGGGWDNS